MKNIHVSRTASKGIAIGKVFLVEKVVLEPENYVIADHEVEQEIEKYNEAVRQAAGQLEKLAASNSIFEAHLELTKDEALAECVKAKISAGLNAEKALKKAEEEFTALFDAMEDEYMRERGADIKDVCERIMYVLKGIHKDHFKAILEPVIVVAKDLTPSDTVSLNMDYVLGFITEEGGVTSHVSIMAKGRGLPALVGVKGILEVVRKDDLLIMDAEKGDIIIHPEKKQMQEYEKKMKELQNEESGYIMRSGLPIVTKDGHKVAVYANVGNLEEAKNLKNLNIKGIGLLRSEFLYMNSSHFPTEEEQFEVYKAIAQQVEDGVIIRTLDIGGDKQLPYFQFEEEENPFLGWRAIRISLDMEEMFKTQMRAMLRASVFGAVKIMFPMIISMDELKKAKTLLKECKCSLKKEGIAFDISIPIGMMIETPASVLCAEEFAQEVDFFSIGTNDLTQYMLAIDRGNKRVAPYYDSFHPAVLKSIKKVIDAGHGAGISVGMCGEFAGDEKAVKILLGMGLDEFSMSAATTPKIKELIRNHSYQEAKRYVEEILR